MTITNDIEAIKTLLVAFPARYSEVVRQIHQHLNRIATLTSTTPAEEAARTKAALRTPGRKCGECLMNDVEIVTLGEDGKCPRCGANYGPEAHQ